MSKLLALDLSTSATGYAIFDLQTKKLLEFGIIKPEIKGIAKIGYPKAPLLKMQNIAHQIKQFLEARPDISKIVIEEINRGIGRMGQKVLDGLHFIILDRIQSYLPLIAFRDSDGRTGWRPALFLVLTEDDKRLNAERRKLNKATRKGARKLPIITKKHLACRWVNKNYGLNLDCDLKETDGDMADAIGLGHTILHGI